MLDNIILFVIPAVAIFGILVSLISYLLLNSTQEYPSWWFSSSSIIIGMSLIVLVDPFATPLFLVGFGGFMIESKTRSFANSPIKQAIVSYGILIGAILLSPVVSIVGSGDFTSLLYRSLRYGAITLPIAGMFPLGGALNHGQDAIIGWGTLTVGSFIFVPLVLTDLTEGGGALIGLEIIAMIVVAIIAAVLGLIPLYMGYNASSKDN